MKTSLELVRLVLMWDFKHIEAKMSLHLPSRPHLQVWTLLACLSRMFNSTSTLLKPWKCCDYTSKSEKSSGQTIHVHKSNGINSIYVQLYCYMLGDALCGLTPRHIIFAGSPSSRYILAAHHSCYTARETTQTHTLGYARQAYNQNVKDSTLN